MMRRQGIVVVGSWLTFVGDEVGFCKGKSDKRSSLLLCHCSSLVDRLLISLLTCVGEEDGLRVGFWCGRGANEDIT
eukprot:scaffold13560_cov122-Alexandrium_tamarense.AAC.3